MSTGFTAVSYSEKVTGLPPNISRRLVWEFTIDRTLHTATLEFPKYGSCVFFQVNNDLPQEIELSRGATVHEVFMHGFKLNFVRHLHNVYLYVDGADFEEHYEKIAFQSKGRSKHVRAGTMALKKPELNRAGRHSTLSPESSRNGNHDLKAGLKLKPVERKTSNQWTPSRGHADSNLNK